MSFFYQRLSNLTPALLRWRKNFFDKTQTLNSERLTWISNQPDWLMLKADKSEEQKKDISVAQSIWLTHEEFLQWSTLELACEKYLYNPWLETQAQRGLQEVAAYELDELPKPWLFRSRFNRALKKREKECKTIKENILERQKLIGNILEQRKLLLQVHQQDDPLVAIIKILKKAEVPIDGLTLLPETLLTPHFDVHKCLFSENHVHTIPASQLNILPLEVVQRQVHLATEPKSMAVTDKNNKGIEEQKSAKHWWWKVWLFVKATARNLSFLTIVVASLIVAATGPNAILVLVLLVASAVFFYTGVIPFIRGVWRRIKDDPKRLEGQIQTGFQDWYQHVHSFKEDWLSKISTIDGFRASFYQNSFLFLQEEYKMQQACLNAYKPSALAFWKFKERAWIQDRKSELQNHYDLLAKKWKSFPSNLVDLLEEKLKKGDLIECQGDYSLGIDKQSLLEIQQLMEFIGAPKDVWKKYNELVNLENSLECLLGQFESELKPDSEVSSIELPWQVSKATISARHWRAFAALLADNDEKMVAVEGLISALLPLNRTKKSIQQLTKHLKILFSEARQETIQKQIGCIFWKTFDGQFSSIRYFGADHRKAVVRAYEQHALEITTLDDSVAALKEHNVAPLMALLQNWQEKYYPTKSLIQSISRARDLWRLRSVYGVVQESWAESQYNGQQSNLKDLLYVALMEAKEHSNLEQILKLLVDEDFWGKDYKALRQKLIEQHIVSCMKKLEAGAPLPFSDFEKRLIMETNLSGITKQNIGWFFQITKKWLESKPTAKAVYHWLLSIKEVGADRKSIVIFCRDYILKKIQPVESQKKGVMEQVMLELGFNDVPLGGKGFFQSWREFREHKEKVLRQEYPQPYGFLKGVLKQ